MINSKIEILNDKDPMLALAIHNGHEMDPELLRICGIGEADRLREEDPYTDFFAAGFDNRIIVYTSRFTIDLNRRREKAVYQNPEDCWDLPARLEPIPQELMTELLHNYGRWYSNLTYILQQFILQNGFILVLDLHSFNHRRQGPDAPPDSQYDNPDIILCRNNMPEKYYPWVEKLRSQLDGKQVLGHKLDCRIDVKFTGGWLSRWLHQTFPDQVLCLAVEFKKIFMDEWTGVLDKKFQLELRTVFQKTLLECKQDVLK